MPNPTVHSDPSHDCRNHTWDGNRFWMVMRFRNDNIPPVIRFCDRSFATREAERLGDLHKSIEFYILCATGVVKVPVEQPPSHYKPLNKRP